MKKKAFEITNGLLLVLLTSIDILLIVKWGLNNDGWLLIGLASFFLFLYCLGKCFPHFVISLIYKIAEKIYKNSDTISMPIFDEAKRTFIKRLPYFLTIANVLMLLLMLIVLLH